MYSFSWWHFAVLTAAILIPETTYVSAFLGG